MTYDYRRARDGVFCVSIRLRPIDEATMEALEDAELLSRSDIVRRALRHYAQALGLEVPSPSDLRPNPKPSNP